MNIIIMMYLILAVFSFFAGVLVLGWISGKSILMDFRRILIRKGCDVYITNSNRNISHYYKVPKNDAFKIEGQTYITNPEKTLNLTSVDKLRVLISVTNFEKRIKNRIIQIDKKIVYLKSVMEIKKSKKEDVSIYKAEIEKLGDSKKILDNKLKQKLNNYFYNKRPAYLYTEGDPVPKDLHEFLTDQDAVILDNLVSRSMSQPVGLKENTKQMNFLKIMMVICLVAVVVCAGLCFRNATALIKICTNLGAGC